MVRTSGIKGSKYAASIGGFSGVHVGVLDEFLSRLGKAVEPAIFQVFDADVVAGWEHIFFASVNAVWSFKSGSSVSRSLGIEVLLYASCQDQISKAFGVVGISEGTRRVALLVLAEGSEASESAYVKAADLVGEADDSVLEVSREKVRSIMDAFGVSYVELDAIGGPLEEALGLAVIERGALLPLRR